MPEMLVLILLILLVSFVYASVGHGGASGYLAALSFFFFTHPQMATSALCLNCLVAGLAFWMFHHAGRFSWPLTWPFILTSIPLAFAGGLVKVSAPLYFLLLAGVLAFAGFRLMLKLEASAGTPYRLPSRASALAIGAGIGLLSGIVGVGGGIFLSPLLILFSWADPKATAATSAFFILVNSVAGLMGRSLRGNFELTPSLGFFVAAAFFGGLAGSWLGARHFPSAWLRRILAAVLFLAAIKLVAQSL